MKIPAWMIAIALTASTSAPGLAGDVTKVPPYDQFLVVPLRVHVLTSKELDLTDGKITDAEVAKVVPRINAIWAKAGISFGLESIVREPAAQVKRVKALLELNNGELPDADYLAYLLPASSRVFDGLHVYIFRDLPMNGMYLTGADAALAKEKPELEEVKGGSKDPLARVAARGLGQALGLAGRADQIGLLSSGTNGVALNESEVGRVRQVARTIPGAFEVDAAAKAAEAASKQGDLARSRRLWTWLSEVPGTGAAEARKKLLALPASKP
jgi:hypothetical protein